MGNVPTRQSEPFSINDRAFFLPPAAGQWQGAGGWAAPGAAGSPLSAPCVEEQDGTLAMAPGEAGGRGWHRPLHTAGLYQGTALCGELLGVTFKV